MLRYRLLLPGVLAIAAALLLGPSPARGEGDLAPLLRASLVKVAATVQGYDLESPWNEQDPRSVQQRGVVVRPGLVLTPASTLSNHRMVEVSVANSARRYPASVAHIDYGANLALLRIEDEDLLARTAPLPIGEPFTIDGECEIWQLSGNDLLERNTGLVQQVNVVGSGLQLTVKTGLSETGNGQAALRDGRLVGLVTQTRAVSQEGRILAVETIRHFLDDFDDGDYRGFGAGGFYTSDLLRDDLRAYYGVPADTHGIAVTRVVRGRTGDGVLEDGDVLVSLAGHDLDDEGMYEDAFHGRLSWYYLIAGTTHPGDEVPARILRKGQPLDVVIPVRVPEETARLVPAYSRDSRPPYMVVGGLVILELTGDSAIRSWALQRHRERADWDPPAGRQRIVYASRVLADQSNKDLDELAAEPIDAVNGVRISRLQDVAAALEKPQGDYHVFTFEGLVKPYVIPVKSLAEIDARIAERYRIPELRYLP